MSYHRNRLGERGRTGRGGPIPGLGQTSSFSTAPTAGSMFLATTVAPTATITMPISDPRAATIAGRPQIAESVPPAPAGGHTLTRPGAQAISEEEYRRTHPTPVLEPSTDISFQPANPSGADVSFPAPADEPIPLPEKEYYPPPATFPPPPRPSGVYAPPPVSKTAAARIDARLATAEKKGFTISRNMVIGIGVAGVLAYLLMRK